MDLRTPETASPFTTIEEAIEDIRSGRFVVVVDDADPLADALHLLTART